MVRLITGSLIDVGTGRLSIQNFAAMIDPINTGGEGGVGGGVRVEIDGKKTGPRSRVCVEAGGLYLVDVHYPPRGESRIEKKEKEEDKESNKKEVDKPIVKDKVSKSDKRTVAGKSK